MIPGFGGDLIAHAYLDEQLALLDSGGRGQFERRLLRWWHQVSRSLGPASSVRAIQDVAVIPLLLLLDHERPEPCSSAAGCAGTLPSANSVLFSVPWMVAPATAWRDAVRVGGAARVSWALVCNARSLRIFDCTRTWTRAAIEFDFDRLLTSPKGIAALWMLTRPAALAGDAPSSLRAHVAASDQHASRVRRSLSDGVLAALPTLASALAAGARSRVDRASSFDQALTILYRILFLLFAEARALVPVWNNTYQDAYSIDALTRRADRSAIGLWEALQAISRLAHAGCRAGDLTVTAFNGRLFSPRHAPLAERRLVADAVIRDVLLSLATEATPNGRRRISYHDLGVEQLGSVYERVLEYEPSQHGATLALARTSTQRKATGSFYTPQALTEFLVRRTLAPLVGDRSSDEILRLRILDPAMGSGAFLVSACRYLAECCEHAQVRDGQWNPEANGLAARATLRRQVAERCLYGVDLNPTAVQLARLSLWLTTLAADRPLTFLDHHLATGNSLIGAWIADLSLPPRPSTKARAALPLFDELIADDVTTRVLPARLKLAIEPSDSLDAVRGKERTLAALAAANGPIAKWTAAADAWCAAALWPGSPPGSGVVSEWIAGASGAATSLPPATVRAAVDRARQLAAAHSAFHWELAFPETFFDENGRQAGAAGFDAVIGNPPWDMLRADTGSSTERSDSRTATSAALRFVRTSRSYRLQGGGHPNRYQLFVERALTLTRPGGRIGLLLPSGIATDHGSATLRRHLLNQTTIDTWLGFENRRRIFPIHRSVRFVVMATTNAGSTSTLRFRAGLTDPASLDHEDESSGMLTLSRSRIEALNPEHLTIPEVTTATALAILTSIAGAIPALADPQGWNVRFGRELNASDDRPHFKKRTGQSSPLLPVVEGKHLAPFRVDLRASTLGVPIKTAASLLDPAITFERSRLAYRDVASATNKLTLIAAMLPRHTVSTHTVFCLKTLLGEGEQWCLLGLLNSLVANFLVRLQVTTHVTTALMSRLPVPRPLATSSDFERLAALSQRLARIGITDDSPDYAELNAIAARLYGLTTDHYAHILESFPLLPQSLRTACLSAYVISEQVRLPRL